MDGPSVEATFAQNGLCVDAEDGRNEYWDDDLTEKERAIICGTYIMHTRPGQLYCKKKSGIQVAEVKSLLDGAGEQTTKVSWFPPPQSWEGSSYDCIEWSPNAEEVFRAVFANARLGKSQPLSAKQWRDRLRDSKIARKAFENNRYRADIFFSRNISM